MAWVGAVVQGVTGIAQTIAASEAAKKLPEARSYGASSSLMQAQKDAERRKKEGVSAAERAAFEQGMARRTGAAERAMRNLGFTGVAQGVSNIFNIDAMSQFSVQNEAERRKGEQMYAAIAGQMQSIRDRETASFNQMLQQQRTALGGAAASGMKNITGAFGTAAQAYNTKQLADAYAKSGDTYNFGTGTTGATTPATTTPSTTTPGIDLSVINTATAPGVGLDGTLEGSGVPFLPAAEQPYIPQQVPGYQGLGTVATNQGAYSDMPGMMQPNSIFPTQYPITPSVVNTQPVNYPMTLTSQDYTQFMQNPSQFIPGGLTNFNY